MSEQAELRFFDLGLAKGIEIERERIIKLLEDLDAWPAKFDRDEALEFLIALIKGEK